jgi:hypothetical protein
MVLMTVDSHIRVVKQIQCTVAQYYYGIGDCWFSHHSCETPQYTVALRHSSMVLMTADSHIRVVRQPQCTVALRHTSITMVFITAGSHFRVVRHLSAQWR